MIKFSKQVVTWSLGIITGLFTLVPEAIFGCYKIAPNVPHEVNIIINRVICFLGIAVLVAIVYGCYIPLRKSINIRGKNYKIVVHYGDIFDMSKCKKVIPFDECFTTEVGQAPAQVKPTSICGQFLAKYPIDNIQAIIDKAQLKPCKGKSKYKSKDKYESGCLVPQGDYLLMAFTKLDEDGLGIMTRDEYLDCLFFLWREINKHYGQTNVCIPVLGSGITRLGDNELTQQELLDMIIGSYKLCDHKIKMPSQLHIVCKPREDFSINKIGEHL